MKRIAVTAFLLLFVFAISAQEAIEKQQKSEPYAEIPELDDPVGREVAEYGTRGRLSGILLYKHDEWHLVSEGIVYELHMGPDGHDAAELFEQESAASVDGFIYRDHISPILIESTTGDISFWTEHRFPVWAGEGDRKLQASGQMEQMMGQPYQQRVTTHGERGEPIPMQRNMEQNSFQRTIP